MTLLIFIIGTVFIVTLCMWRGSHNVSYADGQIPLTLEEMYQHMEEAKYIGWKASRLGITYTPPNKNPYMKMKYVIVLCYVDYLKFLIKYPEIRKRKLYAERDRLSLWGDSNS